MWRTRRNSVLLGRIRKTIASERLASSSSPELIEVGHFAEQRIGSRYKSGQVFLHRVFAYRGIILSSYDCKEFGRKQGNNQYEVVPYYQALVHQQDWKEMRFSNDMTAFLSDRADSREAKISVITGMDCLPHYDIIPLDIVRVPPIEHALFKDLFKLVDEEKPEMGYGLFREPITIKRNWLTPQTSVIERAESITIMVTTYYLGAASINGHTKHCWRYVVRLENHDPERDVFLRERNIKIFSLNNLSQLTSAGVVGTFPRLTREHPAYQFSSTIDLPNKRGGHMWGKIKMERQDGSAFEIPLPTVLLECHGENSASQTNENIIH